MRNNQKCLNFGLLQAKFPFFNVILGERFGLHFAFSGCMSTFNFNNDYDVSNFVIQYIIDLFSIKRNTQF